MSVLSGQTIRRLGLVNPCLDRKETILGGSNKPLSYGLGPAGYDLTLDWGTMDSNWMLNPGEFRLGAASERFQMPNNVIGMVYDKSSWARRGLSLFNTVIEPGWCGFLTLELTNLSNTPLYLPQGVPIAQVVFTYLDEPTQHTYAGKYQNQEAGPQEAR